MKYLALLLLAGCAAQNLNLDAPDYRYTWEDKPRVQALEPVVVVDSDAWWENCKTRSTGCAIRKPEQGKCFMYFAVAPMPYIEWHERKHCRGFEHAERG